MYDFTFDNMAGESDSITRLKVTARHIARMDAPVLIWGETGTGKEMLAHSIHNESARKNKPFVAINCRVVSSEKRPQELERGFNTAAGGTLFLGGIENIPPEAPADIRIISSTNRNLDSAVEKGNFREDLYYKLNTITLKVPPQR